MKGRLEKYIKDWNRKNKVKIRLIGGFARKGHSDNDVDILLSKHLPHKIEARLAQKISEITGIDKVDVFNPITKSELKALEEENEFGDFGWRLSPDYKPDFIITRYEKGFPLTKGIMSKEDFQQFPHRVKELAYRDALRRYIQRKIYGKYSSKMPKKILDILKRLRIEEKEDEELLRKYGISRKKITKVQQEMGFIKEGMYIDTEELKNAALQYM